MCAIFISNDDAGKIKAGINCKRVDEVDLSAIFHFDTIIIQTGLAEENYC